MYRRYKTPKDAKSSKNIEHDAHDLEYLVLGLHCRALATSDASPDLKKATMGWRYRFLLPDGLLITLPERADMPN